MKILRTDFDNLLLIKPEIHIDSRGFFKETFQKKLLEKFINKKINFCQDNIASSSNMVLRGLHYQEEPFSQSKLIFVTSGKILDIVVDIRKNSKTYGKYFSIELSSDNHKILFIPKGFAHGYLTLSNKATISYKVDNYYNKDYERGISFNDPFLNIDFGIDNSNFNISNKDKNLPNYTW